MKNKKKIKKNNPIAKLLKLPMLRNKIIKNKKKFIIEKNSNWKVSKEYE